MDSRFHLAIGKNQIKTHSTNRTLNDLVVGATVEDLP
jgi:hypothetical protein